MALQGPNLGPTLPILFPKPSPYYMPGLYYVRQKIYVDRGASGGKTYRHFLRLRLVHLFYTQIFSSYRRQWCKAITSIPKKELEMPYFKSGPLREV